MTLFLLGSVIYGLVLLAFFEWIRAKNVSRKKFSALLLREDWEAAAKNAGSAELKIALLRRSGALEEAEQLSARATPSLPVQVERAKLLAHKARTLPASDALPLLDEALELHPLPGVQRARAEQLLELARPDEAESAYRTLLQCGETVSGVLGLGSLLEQQGRHQEALQTYQGKRVWDQGDARLLQRAGICALHLEQYRYAEQYLRESMQRGLRSAESLAYLGYTLECQGRWSDSQEVYWDLTRRYPADGAGYRGLGWLYGVGRSVDLESATALRLARRATELQPIDSSWEILSACEARAGNLDAAHAILERLGRQEAIEQLRGGTLLGASDIARSLVA